MRNGVGSLASTSTSSRKASSADPPYHGMLRLGDVTLSPYRAETGIAMMLSKFSAAANLRKPCHDRVEGRLAEFDQVHLVHRQHDVTDAEQRDDGRVAQRLGQQALAGIDQDDGELAVRRSRGHVAGVLLVAGRVGDDEGAPRRREIAVRDVDRDALLALGVEPVEQQREVELVAGRAVLARRIRERVEVVVEDQAGVVQQSPDQRRLAVVDRAAGQQAQPGPHQK